MIGLYKNSCSNQMHHNESMIINYCLVYFDNSAIQNSTLDCIIIKRNLEFVFLEFNKYALGI